MYTWRALQLYYFCSWSLALVLSSTLPLIFGSGGFGVPCELVAPLDPLGLAGDVQQNTQGYITNYRNNNRHLTYAGGGGGLLLWFPHWRCVAYRWRMVHRRVRTPVSCAAACRAFPSVISRDPCVVGVVKKHRGGSISAAQCKILKKGEGKQTICKKYETVHLPRRCGGGGGCGRGGLVACLLLFAAEWRRSKLLTTHQVAHVDLAQGKKNGVCPRRPACSGILLQSCSQLPH